MARAKLAQQILSDRLVNRDLKDLKFAFIGINSILEGRPQEDNCEPYEIRLRAVGRSDSRRAASLVPREVEALYTNGPAGGGGVVGSTKETIGIHSLLIPRELVSYQIHYQVS